MKRMILAGSAICAMTLAAPASAADFLFTATGLTVSFSLPGSPTPNLVAPNQGFAVSTNGVVNGTGRFMQPTFFNTNYTLNSGISGGFSYDGSLINAFSGAQLYTGSEAAPSFLYGTFQLSNSRTGATGVLVVSNSAAVPEPSTWAFLIVGFGATGAALRHRAKTVVKFA